MLEDLDTLGPMGALIKHYAADLGSLTRFYNIPFSPARRQRLGKHYSTWLAMLQMQEPEELAELDADGKVDYLLFRNELNYQIQQLEIQQGQYDEVLPLLPFAPAIIDLAEDRQRMQFIEPQRAASIFDDLARSIPLFREKASGLARPVVGRAVRMLVTLRELLKGVFDFYNGYDPEFTWWAAEPFKAADDALGGYLAFLRTERLGLKPEDTSAIIGDPLGEAALLADLAREFIPYSPEELMQIGQREFDWCRRQMQLAAAEMGCGDDWRSALERVKSDHVPPGRQPHLVRDLAVEAIDFIRQHELMIVPPVALETWRMEMMSPEKQKVNPFFLGGEVIAVSFPTHTMSHAQKLMAVRGNNRHFARATVQHELIPGHQVQEYMTARYKPYRQLFNTPFWVEGWTIHWEMLLWDMNFPRTPENRIGMLFWRAHRCARILFSLGFHLGRLSPQQCIDMLVEEVGHERDNAEAEVRRSFSGDYPPLYQAAYMLGGLQMHALHRECISVGMSQAQFHNQVLRQNSIPVELLRARLLGLPLGREYVANWRFYDL